VPVLAVALLIGVWLVRVRPSTVSQQLAVPSYIHPGADPEAWNRLIGSPSDKVGVVVANVLNGPDGQRNPLWADVMTRAHASGKRVLGYVDTGYLGQTGLRTRLGSADPADWMAQVNQEVDGWYEWYGAAVDGIFFDQGFHSCGDDNVIAGRYAQLHRNEKDRHPGSMTVLNSAAAVPQCYEDSADVLLTYEGDYASYFGRNPSTADNFQDPGWVPRDPHKFWHIVYDVGADHLAEVLDASRERNAAYVYVTDDRLPNPYDVLPGAAYWDTAQAGVDGRPASTTGPAGPPG
jgi:hypothetical protein